MTVGIDISNGCVVEYYSETGSRITDQEVSGKKNHPFFQASVVWLVVFSMPLRRAQLYCLGTVCPPVPRQ